MRNNYSITEQMKARFEDLDDITYEVRLNTKLIEDKQIGQTAVANIFAAHGKKCFLFDNALNFLSEIIDQEILTQDNIEEIKYLNEQLRDLEYEAQEAWTFPKNAAYHVWWLDMPGCSCPTMDNYDLMGADRSIINTNCIWHGSIQGEDNA